MMKKDKITTIVMSQDLFDKTKEKANGMGLNFSNYLRMLIIKDLNDKGGKK